VRIAGHPLHPALVHFPLALWFAAVLWDGLGLWNRNPLWWQLSYWCLALGLAVSLLAILTGLIDYFGLRPDEPGMNAATAHAMVMMSAAFGFGASFLMRAQSGAEAAPSVWALVFSFGGALLLAAGGWLGGILVYRYRIGTDGHR
jgi:uncharacterized membrane protein